MSRELAAPDDPRLDRFDAGLDRFDAGVTSLIALGALVLYLLTLAPGLLTDDSGEFQTMARLLGHTHPTGYELYTLFARALASIPIGDFPSRVSAFSATMGAIAVAETYLAARLIGSPKEVAVVAAVAVAVAPTFWSQAIIAEVYTPAAALGTLVIVCVLLWYRTARSVWLALAGAAGGLGLGVHFSIGLYLPAVIVFLLLSSRDRIGRALTRTVWLPAIGGAAVGVTVAVLAFVAVDLVDPPAEYFDAVVAPSRSAWDLEEREIDGTLERMRFNWTARQFSSLMFDAPMELIAQRFRAFRAALPSELGVPILAAAGIGVISLLWRRAELAALLLIALGSHVLFAFTYDIGDLIYVFYIPAYVLLALLAAAGLTAVAPALARFPRVSARVAAVGVGAIALTAGVIPIARPNLARAAAGEVPPFAFEGYPYDDFVATTMRPVLEATVTALPQEAVILVDWEFLYPYYFVAHVEMGRQDLVFHETYPADDQEGLAASMVDYLFGQAGTRPVYVSERLPELSDAGFTFLPVRVGPTPMLKLVSP
jgi:hypothetical protein